MSQNCLSIVLKIINFLIDAKIPKSFDELAQIILKKNNDESEYDKNGKKEVIEEKEIIEAINDKFNIEAETFFGY